MSQFTRYKWVIVALLVDCILFAWDQSLGQEIAQKTAMSFIEMLSFIPPIFVILGLLDVWVPREKVVNHLGAGSGIIGVMLAILIGSAAAGPLYGAFPVAAVMMKKGAGFFNIMVFIGAWATLKIPMFLFETQYMGGLFSVTRWFCSLVGIVLIAWIIEQCTSPEEMLSMYVKHQQEKVS